MRIGNAIQTVHKSVPKGTRRLRLFAMVVIGATLSAGLASFTAWIDPSPAEAAAGNPGTPSAPVTLFTEDFENAGPAQVPVTSYTGATGQTYSAAGLWGDVSDCNGIVTTGTATFPAGYCNQGPIAGAVQTTLLANARNLGAYNGEGNGNHAVSAMTATQDVAPNLIEFQTRNRIPLEAENRFLAFSVNVAAACSDGGPNFVQPQLAFYYLNEDGTQTPATNGSLNICAGRTGGQVGTLTSNRSLLYSGTSVGLTMHNVAGGGSRGNDHAFDDIKILDVTPQLDKSFSPAEIRTGGTSTLTFTVTNTSELGSKNGWSFTDDLPEGLRLASPTEAVTDCPAGEITAVAGDTTVGVTGNLTLGMTSCTVTVDVTTDAAGSYTNGPDNVTETGLNPPGESTLIVTDPPAWTCSAFGYLFQSPADGTHSIYQVDLVSGVATPVGTTTRGVNAVGYNPTDDYVYGWTDRPVKVGSDGTDVELPVPDGVPADVNFVVGDFDSDGHYWIEAGGSWYEVDYAAGSATYGELVDSGPFDAAIGDIRDWVYVDGALYGVARDGSLRKFDTTTHEVSNLGLVPGVPPATSSASDAYGAGYADASGYLYFSDNANGEIYRINPVDLTSIDLSTGPIASGNDGTRCASAPIPTITVTKTVEGRAAAADQFTVGLQNSAGTVLDSATTSGTETSVSTVDWPVSQGATYTLTDAMAAGSTNTIDGYAQTVVCTDSSGAAVPTSGTGPTWTFTVPGADAYSCEVTNAPNEPAFTVSKAASATSVQPGGTVTYTVTVTNTGTTAYTEDNPASFTDDLSAVLDDAVYNGDATGGATVTGSTLSWSGPLAVDATETITYSVTVRDPDNGDHVLENAVVPGEGGECDPAGECATSTPVQSFRVTKTADTDEVIPGGTITYTVTVTNTGEMEYTADDPAAWSDDLTEVLDDATYNDDVTGGATYTAPTLAWSGPLAVDETVTFTYTVTVNDPDTGDQELHNAVVTTNGGSCPDGATDPACFVDIPSGSYTVSKTASSTSVLPGETVTYTVTVTNTGDTDYTADEPASFIDDLSGVLDDASYNGDATNGATVTGTDLVWSGPLPSGESVTVTYTVTVNDPDTGDKTLTNAVRPDTGGGGCDPDSECTTTTPVRTFTVAKTSSPAGNVHPGDVVTYTVTVTNTGAGDFTVDQPASFADDLSAVLDDATYNDDADNGATVTDDMLLWSGALAAGESTTITYSVTVDDTGAGDGTLTNAVVPGDGGDCTNEDDCATTNDVQSFTVSKTADPTGSVSPGDVVTYTVTVTNTGAAAYTAADPASFTDDLSAVLDDATYNDDASDGATYAEPVLTWAGALGIDDTVTVTYSVTVGAAASGDGELTNAVVPGDGGECDPEGECSTTNPLQAFTVSKAASATSAKPRDTITYTITVTNVGEVDYTTAEPATFTDNLTAVLDDAVYNDDATHGAGYEAPVLTWGVAVPVDGSVTVSYSVTVNDPDNGDHRLRNVVSPGTGGDCDAEAGCETDTPVQSFSVEKTADTDDVVPGGVITYTITVTNTGTVDYTEDDPASWTDDLSAVLDDASYNDDVTGGAAYSEPQLSWSGPLAAGATETFTYSVTVNDPATGDQQLHNAVVTPADGGCPAGSTDPRCAVDIPSGSYTVAKTASEVEVAPGETVTYTVTVTNTGDVDYTTENPASFVDDLSSVLDDAVYNDDATGGAVFAEPRLSWSGALAVGESIEITYSVTVNDPDAGDRTLTNVVQATTGGGECDPDASCSTTTDVQSFVVAKSSDASNTAPSDVVTYTITVTNTGQAAFTADKPAVVTDDLSEVLDDAEYNGDASDGGTYDAPTLTWALAVPIDGSVSVTYSVTVDSPDSGDHELKNTAIPGKGGDCDPSGSCSTDDPVAGFTVTKAVDKAAAVPGDVVAYTITVENTGKLDYTEAEPAAFTDDLSDVLDDATYNGDATDGAVYEKPVLSWSGPLSVGAVQTITYTVTVNSPATGDKVLDNTVMTPSGGNCIAGTDLEAAGCHVSTTVRDPLAQTGLSGLLPFGVLSAILLALGGALVVRNERRRRIVE